MIDKTAVIDKTAKLGKDVTVGPYAIIGPGVEVGDGCHIHHHAVIAQDTIMGKNNQIFQFASVGDNPQDKKYSGQTTQLIIGDNNIIRECVTLNRGTVEGGGKTTIGSDNLFMAYCHVGHDCHIGNQNVFANSATLGGHVLLGNQVIISAFCAVHQYCQVGDHSFFSGGSLISKDVPPYIVVIAGANTACGINVEGLKRRGFTPEEIQWIRRAYRVIYRDGLKASDAIIKIREMEKDCDKVKPFADFLENSKRGIVR